MNPVFIPGKFAACKDESSQRRDNIFFYLIGIHFMQDWTATARQEVAKIEERIKGMHKSSLERNQR